MSAYRQPEPSLEYDFRPRLESEQEYFTEVALHESRRWIEVGPLFDEHRNQYPVFGFSTITNTDREMWNKIAT